MLGYEKYCIFAAVFSVLLMKRKISMTFMAALLPLAVFAAGDWKGKVVDEKGVPVPFALADNSRLSDNYK